MQSSISSSGDSNETEVQDATRPRSFSVEPYRRVDECVYPGFPASNGPVPVRFSDVPGLDVYRNHRALRFICDAARILDGVLVTTLEYAAPATLLGSIGQALVPTVCDFGNVGHDPSVKTDRSFHAKRWYIFFRNVPIGVIILHDLFDLYKATHYRMVLRSEAGLHVVRRKATKSVAKCLSILNVSIVDLMYSSDGEYLFATFDDPFDLGSTMRDPTTGARIYPRPKLRLPDDIKHSLPTIWIPVKFPDPEGPIPLWNLQ